MTDDLVEVLIDLAIAMDLLNALVLRQGAERAGQAPLSSAEVLSATHLIGQPEQSVADLSTRTQLPLGTTRAAVVSLLRRGMIEEVPAAVPRRAATYRVTEHTLELRKVVRARAAQQVRYVLSSLPGGRRAELESVIDALSALTVALGFQGVHDLHPTYPDTANEPTP